MSKMEWPQMRPIHDAAAALDGLSDDATSDELGLAVTTAITHLTEALSRFELSDRMAARLIPHWKQAGANLREVVIHYSSEISQRLLEVNKGKVTPVVIDTGEQQIVCTPRISKRRTEVERDALTKAVERVSAETLHRLNPNGTGELLDYGESKVLLLKKCFRLEPRWNEIKKLGIQDDEFCKHETTFTLDIKEGATL